MILGETLSFFLFELLMLALLGVCLLHCLEQQRVAKLALTLELTVFILYGLGFESIAVGLGFYDYGPFALTVGHAPLAIGIGWGVIGFSAMGFSDSLNMPQWSKPFLDALFALLIDLGMDAIAIRDRYLVDGELTGMWNWPIALNEGWFGVPYANFMAWFLVVFIMSAALRSGRYARDWFGKAWLEWLYPLVALAISLGIFLFLMLTFSEAFGLTVLLPMLALAIWVSTVSIRGQQYHLSWRSDSYIFLVPLAFHLYFLGLMLWRKLYAGSIGILWVSLLVFAVHEIILAVAVCRKTYVASDKRRLELER